MSDYLKSDICHNCTNWRRQSCSTYGTCQKIYQDRSVMWLPPEDQNGDFLKMVCKSVFTYEEFSCKHYERRD